MSKWRCCNSLYLTRQLPGPKSRTSSENRQGIFSFESGNREIHTRNSSPWSRDVCPTKVEASEPTQTARKPRRRAGRKELLDSVFSSFLLDVWRLAFTRRWSSSRSPAVSRPQRVTLPCGHKALTPSLLLPRPERFSYEVGCYPHGLNGLPRRGPGDSRRPWNVWRLRRVPSGCVCFQLPPLPWPLGDPRARPGVRQPGW